MHTNWMVCDLEKSSQTGEWNSQQLRLTACPREFPGSTLRNEPSFSLQKDRKRFVSNQHSCVGWRANICGSSLHKAAFFLLQSVCLLSWWPVGKEDIFTGTYWSQGIKDDQQFWQFWSNFSCLKWIKYPPWLR